MKYFNFTSNICANCVSLLENMAWMQWIAYLAWRGGPFLALWCNTGSKALGGKKNKGKKKRDKYLFTSCILKIFQNIKLAKKHRYTYIEHTTSAKLLIVLILAISSKKEKKGYLHGLQVKNPWVLLIKYHVVKQTFYLHKLLKAVLEILLSTHAH